MRRTYFAFKFAEDIFRANQVRNHNIVLGAEDAGFIDDSEWEEVRLKDPITIASRIRERIARTTVTIVLVGRETWRSQWVNYEIQQSVANLNGLLVVYIHTLKDPRDMSYQSPFPLPQLPSALPPSTPASFWDPNDQARIRDDIEAAGKRADQLRATVGWR